MDRVGKKMPENIRTAPIKFEKLADYITEEYSQAHHADSRNVKQRLEKLKEHFGARAAWPARCFVPVDELV